MNYSPIISVLMPVYNSERYLKDAVASILNQSYNNFEFIIINDGSTDNSWNILEEFARSDARICLIKQENKGIVEALNRGIGEARGKYIARMDSDDISLPDRLAKQVAFMEAHPNVGVCGTWIRYFDGKNGEWQTPAENRAIQCELIFGSALAHPSVVIRKDILTKNMLIYRHGYEHAEDYDLWARVAQYAELANIPEVLLLYRVHSNQIVQQHTSGKIASANLIRKRQLEMFGLNLSIVELAIFNRVSMWNFCTSIDFLESAESLLLKLLDCHPTAHRFDSITLRCIVQARWFDMCYASSALGLRAWYVFRRSHISIGIKLTWTKKIKFLIRCLIYKRALHE